MKLTIEGFNSWTSKQDVFLFTFSLAWFRSERCLAFGVGLFGVGLVLVVRK